MPNSTTTPANPSALPLRLREPLFTPGEWPCPEDRLRRKQEIENLTPVLLNAEAPLVFAIDAPWGDGKTTFIRLWQHFLNKENKVSLYLNAWESDFAEDPLLPMLATLDKWLSEQSEKPAVKAAWDKAKTYVPGIIKSTAVAAAKAATFGALDLDKEYEKLATELTGGAVGSLVDSFNVKQRSLEQFKIQLTAALDALPEDQQNLIVFVDELDRCKPTYAIEVLERIKHLFDIDRLVFVLAVNRDQLSKSLQGVYGPSFDGMHYLKRFIDLDYHLRVTDIKAYIEAKFDQPDVAKYFASRQHGQDHFGALREVTCWLAQRFGYTLRGIDQLVIRLRLILKSIPTNHHLEPVVLACMLILRSQNEGLYQRFALDALCVNDVIEFFLGAPPEEAKLPESFGWIAGWLIRSGCDYYNAQNLGTLITPWEQLMERLDEKDERRNQISSLIRLARDNQGMRGQSSTRQTAFNRIELVNQIDVSA